MTKPTSQTIRLVSRGGDVRVACACAGDVTRERVVAIKSKQDLNLMKINF